MNYKKKQKNWTYEKEFFKWAITQKSEQLGYVKVGRGVTNKNKWYHINNEVEKLNYEKNINEYKKLRILIQKVIVRNTAIISQNYYDRVRIEYGQIIKELVIPKVNDDIPFHNDQILVHHITIKNNLINMFCTILHLFHHQKQL